MSAEDVVRFRWEAAAFLLAFLLQLGVVIWYESSRSEALIAVQHRVAELEAAHKHDLDVLSSMDGRLSTIAGQLTIITSVLLNDGNTHIGRGGSK